MVGRVKTFGYDPNDFTWSIPDSKYVAFEKLVVRSLRKMIATADGRVRVSPTRSSSDQGRDAEIYFSQPFLLGSKAVKPTAERNVAYIECKATKHNRLDDNFLADASQHEASTLSAHILATNATISPYAHYRAQKQWRQLGVEFILLDSYLLWTCLVATREVPGELTDLLPATPPKDGARVELIGHAQCRRERQSGEHRIETYLTVRNYSTETQQLSITSASDLSWESDADIQRVLDPGSDCTYRFLARQQVYGIGSELKIAINSHNRSTQVSLTSPVSDLILEPLFTGQEAIAQSEQIRDWVSTTRGFRFISVEGQAGIGKTRIISEALVPLEGGGADIFWARCDPDSGRFDFAALTNALGQQNECEIPPTAGPIAAVSLAATHDFPVVLVLEDLHHASTSDILELKKVLVHQPPTTASITVIVSGRNDDTFPNADYYALLELVRIHSADLIEVRSLKEGDARALIRSIAYNLPKTASERIFDLGQCNPFIIIEIIQFLLDTNLAQLLTRQTIGVSDPARFLGLDGIPKTVEELFINRFEALASADNGEEALDLLCFMSFQGPQVPIEILEAFLPEPEEVLAILRRRRMLTFSTKEGLASFMHENQFHAIRSWLRERADAREGARRLVAHPRIAEFLVPFQYGELLFVAELFKEAFLMFRPIWDRVMSVTNFSSEQIDRTFFVHLPSLYLSGKILSQPVEALAKVAKTMGYMGVHNTTLFQGEQACEQALNWLRELFPNKPNGREHIMAIRQLRAHALQNMGRTREALKEMIELQAEILKLDCESSAVKYDLFDRLQTHYCRANHLALMKSYADLASDAVSRAKDERLLSSHLISKSQAVLYNGEKTALRAARKALSSAEKVGMRRFVAFNMVTELIAKVHYSSGDGQVLSDIREEAKQLLDHVVMENFSDSLVRLHFLLATLELYLDGSQTGNFAQAWGHLRAGQEAAVRFGIGLYDWGLANLDAVLHTASGSEDESIQLSFHSCLDLLRRRDLLFVGACDGIFPNVLAITNIIRFRASFSEKDAADILVRYITAYQPHLTIDRQATLSLIAQTEKGKPIFWPKGKHAGLRYPLENGYFTPIF